MSNKRITIKDIAEAAGVSPATVSRVLNDKRNVRPEIAARVRSVVEAMDYRANEYARGLAKGKTNALGVVVPDISNTFFSLICKAIQSTVLSTGAAVYLHNTDGVLEREREVIKELASKLITSIFLVAPRMDFAQIRTLADELGIFPVVVDARVENCRLAAVWVDNVTAFIEATDHLIGLGHRRIGFIGGPSTVANSQDRLEGYRIALRNAGIKANRDWVAESDFTTGGGFQAAKTMFGKTRRPTAVLCANDLMAIGALSYFRSCGIRIPEDVSVVGCDDIDVASSLHPPLTTVSQPIYGLGETAAHLMHQYTSEETIPPNAILHAELITRESTADAGGGGET